MGLFSKRKGRKDATKLSKVFNFIRYKAAGHKAKAYLITSEGLLESKSNKLVVKLKYIDAIQLGKASATLQTHRKCVKKPHGCFLVVSDSKNKIEVNLEFVADDAAAIEHERFDFVETLLGAMSRYAYKIPDRDDHESVMEDVADLPADEMLAIPLVLRENHPSLSESSARLPHGMASMDSARTTPMSRTQTRTVERSVHMPLSARATATRKSSRKTKSKSKAASLMRKSSQRTVDTTQDQDQDEDHHEDTVSVAADEEDNDTRSVESDTAEITAFEDNIHDDQTSADPDYQAAVAFKHQILDLKTENSELHDERREHDSKVRALEQELASKNRQLSSAQRECDAKHEELSELKEENAKLHARGPSRERKDAELKGVLANNEELKNENKNQKLKVQELEFDLKLLRENQKKRFSSKDSEASKHSERESVAHTQAKQRLRDEIQELQSTNDELLRERNTHSNIIAENEEAMAALRRDMSYLRDENERISHTTASMLAESQSQARGATSVAAPAAKEDKQPAQKNMDTQQRRFDYVKEVKAVVYTKDWVQFRKLMKTVANHTKRMSQSNMTVNTFGRKRTTFLAELIKTLHKIFEKYAQYHTRFIHDFSVIIPNEGERFMYMRMLEEGEHGGSSGSGSASASGSSAQSDVSTIDGEFSGQGGDDSRGRGNSSQFEKALAEEREFEENIKQLEKEVMQEENWSQVENDAPLKAGQTAADVLAAKNGNGNNNNNDEENTDNSNTNGNAASSTAAPSAESPAASLAAKFASADRLKKRQAKQLSKECEDYHEMSKMRFEKDFESCEMILHGLQSTYMLPVILKPDALYVGNSCFDYDNIFKIEIGDVSLFHGNVEKGHCMVLLTANGTLQLQAPTQKKRDEWLRYIQGQPRRKSNVTTVENWTVEATAIKSPTEQWKLRDAKRAEHERSIQRFNFIDYEQPLPHVPVGSALYSHIGENVY